MTGTDSIVLLHSTFVLSKYFHTHEIEYSHASSPPGGPGLCFVRPLGLGGGSCWPGQLHDERRGPGEVSLCGRPHPASLSRVPWLWLGPPDPCRQLGQGLGPQSRLGLPPAVAGEVWWVRAEALAWEQFCLAGNMQQCLESFWVVTTGVVTGI